MKTCGNYVGVACVDGNCPNAILEGCDGVRVGCSDCFYNRGCEDCALFETEYCDEGEVTQ